MVMYLVDNSREGENRMTSRRSVLPFPAIKRLIVILPLRRRNRRHGGVGGVARIGYGHEFPA